MKPFYLYLALFMVLCWIMLAFSKPIPWDHWWPVEYEEVSLIQMSQP